MNNENRNIIEILPDFIANQIAAGEVVQKPESVVKELVENSLDSGADSIAVIVKGAGKNLIHIVDNGSGMNKDDLQLSIKRHATSKIKSTDDLEEIKTFGFRGEALASIASIALLEIRTKQENSEYGWKLVSEPMSEPEITAFQSEKGTQIFVKNLFYNVPARRKFLKSNLTEFKYISDTMIKFALSHPEIRFTFYDEDILIFDVKPSSLQERIGKVLGHTVSDYLMPVYFKNDFITISGFVGQPHLAKQSKSGQYLFLNGRAILSNALSYAVYSAFEHLIDKNKKPIYIINIDVDYKFVDVNVHPQKHEVKFEDEKIVFNAIRNAVYSALEQYDLTPTISISQHNAMAPVERIAVNDSDDSFMLVNTMTGEIIDSVPSSADFKYKPQNNFSNFKNNSNNSNNSEFNNDYYTRKKQFDNITPANQTAYKSLFENKPAPQKLNSTPSNFEVEGNKFWQLHNKYIFYQSEKGVIIIDQHNAHERIIFERAIKSMNKELSNAQSLLFPVNIKLDASKIAVVKSISEELHNLGFVFEVLSSDSISLSSVPIDVSSGSETLTFLEIIDSFDANAEISHTNLRESIAATFSCKSAIKTGQKLSDSEMKSIATQIFKCEMPYVCPHGRPIILNFTLAELDKSFGRT